MSHQIISIKKYLPFKNFFLNLVETLSSNNLLQKQPFVGIVKNSGSKYFPEKQPPKVSGGH